MRSQVLNSMRRGRREVEVLVSRLAGGIPCKACGFRGRLRRGVGLWQELIDQWELSPEWAEWFNEREGYRCVRCDSNPRSAHLAHAIMEAARTSLGVTPSCLNDLCDEPSFQTLRIAEINSIGNLHRYLTRCPHLMYSEYGGRNPQTPSEDLSKLSYDDDTFDWVLTSETLEHVPDIDVALGEIRRVLKPGGLHVFTVPIVMDQDQTRQRAHIENGEVVHDLPPSYHGVPVVNKNDYLVFYEYGADFVPRCERAGFDVLVLQDRHNPAIVAFIATKPMA